MTMKRNVAKNYVKAMCACIMFALSMAVIPTYASAQQMLVLLHLVVL